MVLVAVSMNYLSNAVNAVDFAEIRLVSGSYGSYKAFHVWVWDVDTIQC